MAFRLDGHFKGLAFDPRPHTVVINWTEMQNI
jgi:hypothetical protein